MKNVENDIKRLDKKCKKLYHLRSNMENVSRQVEKIIDKYLIKDDENIYLSCSDVGGDGITVIDMEGGLALLEDVIILISNKTDGKFTYEEFFKLAF